MHRVAAERRSAALFQSLSPAAKARLLSASSSPGSAWLETVPYAPQLRIPDLAFQASAKLRLGVLATEPEIGPNGQRSKQQSRTCRSCGKRVQGGDMLHALTCQAFGRLRTERHNLIADALRRIGARAGCASTREPRYDDLGSHSETAGRGDIFTLLTPGPGRVAVDVAVTCPLASTNLPAAATQGGAARKRENAKYRNFRLHGESGLAFRPFVVETGGYLGGCAMRYLRELAAVASSTGRVHRGRFLAGAFQEISVALCIGNGSLAQAGSAAGVASAGSAYVPPRPVRDWRVGG